MSVLACADAMALTGRWRGDLAVGGRKLPLVFVFTESADGSTGCSLDSPSQGAKDIPAEVTLCTADSIALTCKAIGATFSGRIADGEIAGRFAQSGFSFPLLLSREQPIEERRPQTPREPFPYTVTDTAFVSADGTRLCGTITMPSVERGRKVPAVVMISGSGPQNRDEEIFEHRPFAVIADYLARNGIASLRYDDRGTALSGGDFKSSTTYIFRDDARSAITFMRGIEGVGPTGALGHSEGGTIAFMLGAESTPDFIVALAGMAVPARETLLAQNRRALDRMPLDSVTKANTMALIGILFDSIAAQCRRGERHTIDIDSIARSSGLAVPAMIANSLKATERARTPWFDTCLTLDPAEYLDKVTCPVLAINGDLDTQVEATSNIAAIKKHVKGADTRIMPGLNHLMQHAETGDSSEYGEIAETISPEVLELILGFCRARD